MVSVRLCLASQTVHIQEVFLRDFSLLCLSVTQLFHFDNGVLVCERALRTRPTAAFLFIYFINEILKTYIFIITTLKFSFLLLCEFSLEESCSHIHTA